MLIPQVEEKPFFPLYSQKETTMKKEDFESLFRLHHSAALRLAFMLLKDEEEAKDAVSDIFTKVWADDIHIPKDRAQGYLLACVHNRCLDQLRQRPLRAHVEQLLTLQAEPSITWTEDKASRIKAIIAEDLTERDREVLLMRYELKMKIREIAAELKISETAVYKHLAKAILTIRDKMKES
jgi:RNA polymerase sigma-70 factor (ECF subfamily)